MSETPYVGSCIVTKAHLKCLKACRRDIEKASKDLVAAEGARSKRAAGKKKKEEANKMAQIKQEQKKEAKAREQQKKDEGRRKNAPADRHAIFTTVTPFKPMRQITYDKHVGTDGDGGIQVAFQLYSLGMPCVIQLGKMLHGLKEQIDEALRTFQREIALQQRGFAPPADSSGRKIKSVRSMPAVAAALQDLANDGSWTALRQNKIFSLTCRDRPMYIYLIWFCRLGLVDKESVSTHLLLLS